MLGGEERKKVGLLNRRIAEFGAVNLDGASTVPGQEVVAAIL